MCCLGLILSRSWEEYAYWKRARCGFRWRITYIALPSQLTNQTSWPHLIGKKTHGQRLGIGQWPATIATWQLRLGILCVQRHMAGIWGRTKGVTWKRLANALPWEETQSTKRTHTTHGSGTGYQRESLSCVWLQGAEQAREGFHSKHWCMRSEVADIKEPMLQFWIYGGPIFRCVSINHFGHIRQWC